MARIKTEDLQLNIFVNGDKGRKEMAKLKQEIQGNKDAIASFNKALKEGKGNRDELNASIKKAETNMASAEAKLKRMQSALKLNDMTLNELRKNLKLTKTALNNAVPGTEAWKKYNAELQATQARIKELSSGGKTVGSMFSNLKASVLPAVAAVAGLARGVKAVAGLARGVKSVEGNLTKVYQKARRSLPCAYSWINIDQLYARLFRKKPTDYS